MIIIDFRAHTQETESKRKLKLPNYRIYELEAFLIKHSQKNLLEEGISNRKFRIRKGFRTRELPFGIYFFSNSSSI